MRCACHLSHALLRLSLLMQSLTFRRHVYSCVSLRLAWQQVRIASLRQCSPLPGSHIRNRPYRCLRRALRGTHMPTCSVCRLQRKASTGGGGCQLRCTGLPAAVCATARPSRVQPDSNRLGRRPECPDGVRPLLGRAQLAISTGPTRCHCASTRGLPRWSRSCRCCDLGWWGVRSSGVSVFAAM